MAEQRIGEVTHYFDKIGVAIIKLEGPLQVGDSIRIKGATTDFKQEVDSMQVDHEKIDSAQEGQELGIKASEKAREGDAVYKIS